jgi:hypothetical protein
MKELSGIPNFPTDGYTGPVDPIFCSTDDRVKQDGCFWGLVVGKQGDIFYVLTTQGVRYYAGRVRSNLLMKGDAGWTHLQKKWAQAIQSTC